jgi:putative methionine-R-sulfoxide reductase with GAF domain
MNRIIGIILVLAGVYLLSVGISRRNSFVGHVDTVASNVANSVNGNTSEPTHVVYLVGGGVLILLGIGIGLRRTARA